MGKAFIIKKSDLQKNISIIKKLAAENRSGKDKPCQIIAVVKGNGYGLGLIEYARFLTENGIDFLAVATVDEAVRLRKAGISVKILMMSSTAIEEEVEALVQNDIIITIGSKEDVNAANKAALKLNKKVEAHLAMDTGFGRYGFVYVEKEKMAAALKELKNVEITGAFTHFSLAFFKKDRYSQKQFERFMSCVEFLKNNNIDVGMLHVCNSSAFFKYKNMRLDAVRIGSAFLGKLAVPNTYGLKTIGQLKSNVTEIKVLPPKYNVGYSNAFTTKTETRVAVIPCGYADGFNVSVGRDMFRKRDRLRYIKEDIKGYLKKRTIYVEINGIRCKVIGGVGLSHVTCDISGKNVNIGDEAIFDVHSFYVKESVKREYR